MNAVSYALAACRTVGKRPQRLIRGLRRDTSGAAVVIAAILFPVVIGGMGLGVETGYAYMTQRKLQHAADVAAHAGAIRLRAGDNHTQIEVAAKSVAARSGVAPGSVDDGFPEVNWPPQHSVALAGDQGSVEVIIERSQPRLFSAVVAAFYGDGSAESFIIAARAVAQVQSVAGSVACVLALSNNASPGVLFSGSADVVLEGCDVHSNSIAAKSVEVSGSARLTADCASAVGGIVPGTYTTLSDADCPKEHVAAIPDPFKTVEAPAVNSIDCRNRNVGTPNGPQTVVTPGNYCNGLSLKGPVRFEPGVYVIHGGDVTVNAGENTHLTGDGVTFFLAGGAGLALNGHARINLSAPAAGPYKGLLFFGARDQTVSHVVNAASGSTLQGAIYAPGSDISYRGNSTTENGCTQLVGRTVTFIGNSTMRSSCKPAGYEDVPSNQTVRLVE